MQDPAPTPTEARGGGRSWIIASNRMPVELRTDDHGHVTFARAAGGLVTALTGALRERDSVWIGWPGGIVEPAQQEDVRRRMAKDGLRPVFLDQQEVERHYHGFCNATIWPMFHYFTTLTAFDRAAWETYQAVNLRFAKEIAEVAPHGAMVWLHDFHLMLAPTELRRLRPDLGIGLFLHIPFPSSEVYRLLPCREELLNGMLGADYVSFHTHDYARHFRSACLRVLGVEAEPTHLDHEGHRVTVGVDPIGVDTDRFAAVCDSQEALDAYADLHARYRGRKVLLGVERLDYTKGILEKLRAFEHYLETHPARQGKVTLLQITVPSRLGHVDYQNLKREIEEEVGRINGRFGRPGATPIEYLHRAISRHELVAMYRFASACLVTPLRDGMNLVAQEYVLCQAVDAAMPQGDGILILSEFAGAANSLSRSLLVNPMDKEQVARAIEEGLAMDPAEKRDRMHTMLRSVRALDCQRWADRFITRMEAAVRVNEHSTSERSARAAQLHALVRVIRSAPQRVLFLDYDGTLREIERRPEQAVPTAEIRELLRSLAASPGTEVHVVSGRRQAELQAWFADLPVYVCAEHGAARRDPEGHWERPEGIDLAWMPHVRRVLEEVSADVPGAFVEEKPAGLAWHYRLADPDYGRWRANELLAQLAQDLAQLSAEVLPGHRVIEVRAMGVNKGSYVAEFARRAGPAAIIVAIGDDRTDLDMYRSLRGDAVTVHVGSQPTTARFFLDAPRQVRAFLRELVRDRVDSERLQRAEQNP